MNASYLLFLILSSPFRKKAFIDALTNKIYNFEGTTHNKKISRRSTNLKVNPNVKIFKKSTVKKGNIEEI